MFYMSMMGELTSFLDFRSNERRTTSTFIILSMWRNFL